ncbi:GntR family transcriptional regulator [Leifsonia sp. NPDC058230]|uniref:GntR family transcriptional regulator n=1 Tax=Leifsonia sp. NPDC058230 TaxID=3346391 RepID=UPI0036D8891F
MTHAEAERPPLFLLVASRVAEDILTGRYPEGALVPSTNAAAGELGLNPATVRHGFSVLVESGLLVKRRGVGMLVAAGARESLLARRRSEFTARHIEPLLREARILGLDPTEVRSLLERGVQREQGDTAARQPSSSPRMSSAVSADPNAAAGSSIRASNSRAF